MRITPRMITDFGIEIAMWMGIVAIIASCVLGMTALGIGFWFLLDALGEALLTL